jgi:hypothetical protein
VWEEWEAGFMAFHAFHTLSFPWPAFRAPPTTKCSSHCISDFRLMRTLVNFCWEQSDLRLASVDQLVESGNFRSFQAVIPPSMELILVNPFA